MSESPQPPANSSEVLLGVIEYAEAKRLKYALEERGVSLILRNNPETCVSGGCKPTLEVIARTEDMPRVAEFLQTESKRAFDGLDFDPGVAAQVFDTEKENAICPACGTQFSTQLKECPDCGLVFVPD